jgi:hypothetical protein
MDTNNIDIIVVPFYKKGIYDEFNEKNSPFNIIQLPLLVEEEIPSKSIENIEYGSRASSSFRTIDLSLYYYSGFQDFLSYRLEQAFPPNKIEAQTSRTHMFGADFECVSGEWGIRGEGAFFTNMGYQEKGIIDYVKGDSLTTGISIDRSYRDNYMNLSALYKKIFVDENIEEEKDEISLIADVERRFSYETKKIEFFSMYNVMSNSLYVNGMLSLNIVENLWLDFLIGIFYGEGEDILSKFTNNDFFLIKCKYNF